MAVISKIPTNVQLSSIKGSHHCREKIADKLSDDAYDWVLATLHQKKEQKKPWGITRVDIKNYFAKKYKGLSISVKQNTYKEASAAVEQVFAKNGVLKKLGLNLDFLSESGHRILDTSEKFANFFHENRHIIDAIVSPKYSAKKSEFLSVVKDKNKRIEAGCFYEEFLYDNPLQGIVKIPTKQERSQKLRGQIKEFFNRNDFSAKEKVVTLQSWRYRLKTEINATKDEFRQYYKMILAAKTKALRGGDSVVLDFDYKLKFDSNKIPRVEREKKLTAFVARMHKSTLDDELYNGTFYPDKLKVVESILAAEIKAHRKKHAASLRAKVKKS